MPAGGCCAPLAAAGGSSAGRARCPAQSASACTGSTPGSDAEGSAWSAYWSISKESKSKKLESQQQVVVWIVLAQGNFHI